MITQAFVFSFLFFFYRIDESAKLQSFYLKKKVTLIEFLRGCLNTKKKKKKNSKQKPR